ncbi:hypothetical protein KI387_017168 [Taxus chinensis]|uniref:FHA domain-containing protein n=1 Tax=Taxus chinensis TaxID=29808 RepID=A0AA38GIQ5_TAXCH|nr:hypothetical protein KI387_017168 [Taxus chinensis]
MNISRQHARIFYDFERKRFALEVMGKNGCDVRGIHYIPGDPPVKLGSQDLVQMGELQFYFLLPSRSIAKQGLPLLPQATSAAAALPGGLSRKRGGRKEDEYDVDNWQEQQHPLKKGRFQGNQDGMRLSRKQPAPSWSVHDLQNPYLVPKQGFPYRSDQKGDSRRRGDHESDMFQQMQSEEKDVVSAVATVLSDLCGPGDWMPMAKLHSELLEHYSGIWHQSRIRKFLSADDWDDSESKGRPWIGLLSLLRRYPEHFVINTRSKGRVTAEFVSLVSLLS